MVAESVPFDPRKLSKSERRDEDLYLYQSPKLGRRVELVGCLALALALKFEFDPACQVFVERPRRLSVNDGQIELSFWTRHDRGRERFWLLVPDDDSAEVRSPRRVHREATAIIESAQAAHISLEFVFEEELVRLGAAVHTWFQLLPCVQTLRDLPSRDSLRRHVLSVFENQERSTFDQIEVHLAAFHRADVRAAVADLIHSGSLTLADPTRLHRFGVVVRRGDRHADA